MHEIDTMEANVYSSDKTLTVTLLEQYELTEDDCNQKISDYHCSEISRTLCGGWRGLPSHLGVPQIYVHDINRNSTEESERRSNFFFGWKELKGSAATYKALIAALLDIDCREDAEGVCRFLKKTKIQPLVQHVQSMYNDSRPPEGIYLIDIHSVLCACACVHV